MAKTRAKRYVPDVVGKVALVQLLVLQKYFIEGRGIGMLDILAIKADVYQLERQGKRLTVYRYLR